MALICTLIPAAMDAEASVVVLSEGDPTSMLDPAHVDECLGYFVIHTPETANRFNNAVAPAIGHFDGAFVQRMMENWQLDPDPDSVEFDAETLIVTGRNDSTVGFRQQVGLIDRYPRATYVVAADSGHALPHERPELLAGARPNTARRLAPISATLCGWYGSVAPSLRWAEPCKRRRLSLGMGER